MPAYALSHLSRYDSSFNQSDTDYPLLVGQTLFFLPPSSRFTYYYYIPPYVTGFYTETNVYRGVYVDEQPNYQTPLKEVEGRNFKITGFSDDGIYVKLIALDDSNDQLIYKFNQTFPQYIIVGWFEKYKKNHINHYFYLGTQIINGDKDINTGQPVSLMDTDEPWKCYDVLYLETTCYYPVLALLLKNTKGECIAVSAQNSKHSSGSKCDQFLRYDHFDDEETAYFLHKGKKFEADMLKRYGPKYGKLIVQNKVEPGMTDEMCEYSWGKPPKIITITKTGHEIEKWVYDYKDDPVYRKTGVIVTTGYVHQNQGMNTIYTNKYLYFEKGKLTEIEQ